MDESLFINVADSSRQVARFSVADGVHSLTNADDDKGINVIVVGYDQYVSFPYPGGMGIRPVNIIVM